MSKSFFKKPDPYDRPRVIKPEAPKLSAKHRHHVPDDDDEDDDLETEKAEETSST